MNLGTHTLKPDQPQRPALEDGCYPVGFSTAWPHGLGYSRRIRRSCAGSLGLKLERALVPVEGCPAVPSPSAEALCGADWTQTFQRGQHPPLRPKARLCPLSLGGSVGGVQAPYPKSWGEGRTGWSKLATPRKGRTGDTEEPRGQPVALEVAWIRAETSRNETAATGAQRRGPGLRLGGAWWEGAPKDKDSAAGGQSQWPRREAWSWPSASSAAWPRILQAAQLLPAWSPAPETLSSTGGDARVSRDCSHAVPVTPTSMGPQAGEWLHYP